jgi:hypothetical protein
MAKAHSRRLRLVTGRPTGMVRVVGLEPTHTCVREILSLVRLPFRHTRAWAFWHGNTVPSNRSSGNPLVSVVILKNPDQGRVLAIMPILIPRLTGVSPPSVGIHDTAPQRRGRRAERTRVW